MASYRLNSVTWGNLILPTTTSSRNVNAAGTWSAYSFVLDRALTLNKVRFFLGQTGSPVAGDYKLEIYSDSSTGLPNASLATATAPASVGNNVWVEWAGLSLACSAHTQYWLVLKNLNATPSTNFFSVNRVQGGGTLVAGDPQVFGWSALLTTNSGSSWTNDVTSAAGPRLEFSDGSFAGLPLQGSIGSLQVYSARESGVKFTSPAVSLRVRGAALGISRNGTPTGRPRYRIYNADTNVLLATTMDTPQALVIGSSSSPWLPLFFSDVIALPASTPLRLVLSETTQSDASTNRYQARVFTTENDANSKALCGSYYSTLSTDGGSSWADTDTEVVPFALILDSGEVGPTGAPGGLSAPYKLPLTRFRRDHLPSLGR